MCSSDLRILATVWPVEFARNEDSLSHKLAVHSTQIRKVLKDRAGKPLVATTTYRLTCNATPVKLHRQEQRTEPGSITEDRCPFPGAPYRFGNDEFSDVFVGRETEALNIRELIDSRRAVLLVTGPSGAGKTA